VKVLDTLTSVPVDLPRLGERFPLAEWEDTLDLTEFSRMSDALSADQIDRLAVSELRRKRLLSSAGDLIVDTEAVIRFDESIGTSQERQLEYAREEVEREAERFRELFKLLERTLRGLGRDTYERCAEQIVDSLRLESWGVEDGQHKPRDGLEQLATMRLQGYEPWDLVRPTVQHVLKELDGAQKLALWFAWEQPEADDMRFLLDRDAKQHYSSDPIVDVGQLGEVSAKLLSGANGAIAATADQLIERMESGEYPKD